MDGISILQVGGAELPLLDRALRALASDLGDPYLVDGDTLPNAISGGTCLAMIAVRGDQVVGAVLAAPVFSTMRGGAGLFVTDLWVDTQARGQGLARRLLAGVLDAGQRRKAGHFLKLSVYQDNPGARAAYDRMGFAAAAHETNMVLSGPALDRLKGLR